MCIHDAGVQLLGSPVNIHQPSSKHALRHAMRFLIRKQYRQGSHEYVLTLFALFLTGNVGATLPATSEMEMKLQNSDSTVLPSTTPEGTPVEAVLSVPQLFVELNITKEKLPVLAVSSAPCQKVCHDKCSMHLEKHCLNITVPRKVCPCVMTNWHAVFCWLSCTRLLDICVPFCCTHGSNI